jgi:hypothetical protein
VKISERQQLSRPDVWCVRKAEAEAESLSGVKLLFGAGRLNVSFP